MQGTSGSRAVFCYAFSVLAQGPQQGSGFVVNLYEDDTLQYTEYAPGHRQTRQELFVLPPGTRMRITDLIGSAGLWLQAVPAKMGTGELPVTESRFGFSGHPIRIVQDLPRLTAWPFRSQAGRNARFLYGLLEDLASILYTYGFVLQPDSFTWAQQIQPARSGGTKKHTRIRAIG
ncbi:MAG: hypothetical protein IKP40_05895 [Clostridia bacterium]|nr:hypothetical protein [Clostridia bacterium]